MKKNYIVLALLLATFCLQAQVMDYKLEHIGENASTGNHEIALVATPDFTETNGNSADMGAVVSISGGGYLLPTNTGFVNDCVFTPPATNICDYEIPATEWDATYLAAPSAASGTYVYQLARTPGVTNIFFDTVSGTPIIMAVFQVTNGSGGPTTGDIKLVENNDAILSGVPAETWLNINFPNIAGGTIDLYGTTDTTPVIFSALSAPDMHLEGVGLYPNPTTGVVSIKGIATEMNVEIVSINGQQIQYIKNSNNTINLSRLQAGVYFMRITTETGFTIKKIIKQ